MLSIKIRSQDIIVSFDPYRELPYLFIYLFLSLSFKYEQDFKYSF